MSAPPRPPRSRLVVNISAARGVERGEWDVYVGRAVSRASDPRCRSASLFANPFRHGRGGITSVEQACECFEELMRSRLEHGGRTGGRVAGGAFMTAEQWRASLLALRGKRLACWCAPDPCHADVLVRLIDELCPRCGFPVTPAAGRHGCANCHGEGLARGAA